MAETVGKITCPTCDQEAEVREEARGKKCLYIHCKGCGTLQPRLAGGQKYMREKAVLFDAPEPETKPEPEHKPEPYLPKPEKSAWDKFWSDDDD